MRWKVLRWRIYAAVMAVLWVIGVLPGKTPPTAVDYLADFSGLLCLTGLVGYAMGWRIIGAGFWKVVFPLALGSFALTFGLVMVGVGMLGSLGLTPMQGILVGGGAAMLISVLEVPMLVALFRYAYRCQRFWAAGKTASVAPTPAPLPRR